MEIAGEGIRCHGSETEAAGAGMPTARRSPQSTSPSIRERPEAALRGRDRARPRSEPLLLEIIEGVRQPSPFQAPFAVDRDGDPVWLDLHHRETAHLLIEGGTSAGRAEALRTLVVGLALTTRPALLQLLAVDFTGRELCIVGALPHSAAETAGDSASAQMSLAWLGAELEARMREGRHWPEMVLVVEDVLALAPVFGRTRSGLTAILRLGGAWGMHVIAGVAARTAGLRVAGWAGDGLARLVAARVPGEFDFVRGGRSSPVTCARVTAADLDRMARGPGRPDARERA